MKKNRNTMVTVLSCTFAIVAYFIAEQAIAGEAGLRALS
jgi:hypothetical protein